MSLIYKLTLLLKKLPLAFYPYKAYMHQYHCIFIHIPKNAGSSVGQLFQDDGSRKHARWYDFRRANAHFYNKYHKFCIVRDPVTRLYSAYCYILAGGNQSAEDMRLMEYVKHKGQHFDQFVLDVLNCDFLILQQLFTPQYTFIYDQNLACQVDTILHYEHLTEEWKTFAQQHQFPLDLPVTNSSKAKRKTREQIVALLSSKAKHKLKQCYQLDFKLLGYSTDF
jgi:hypothetical protein